MYFIPSVALYLLIFSLGVSVETHENKVNAGLIQPHYLFFPLQYDKGVKISKRDAPLKGSVGLSEGGQIANNVQIDSKINKAQAVQNDSHSVISQKTQDIKDFSFMNDTIANSKPNEENQSSKGVVKRGLIVFFGFALLAVAYFIFYRRKNNKNDISNLHSNAPESLQFRYGVLNNEQDNLELSRVPLTMESDESDDDLEIFDLEQNRRNMSSYTNLKTQEDEPFNIINDEKNNKDNLLLDIEDKNSDTLINLTGHGSKSML